MIQRQSWSVPMAHLWLLFKKMGYQEENYNFWDFSTTIFDIKCRLWMRLAPALVHIEAWFSYMLFLDLLSAKPCLWFLIELIEQILHTIKFGEILWSQAVSTYWGFKRGWNITGKIWDTVLEIMLCWLRNCKKFYHLNKHETANFGQDFATNCIIINYVIVA
jgi:hypothetical protein